MNEELMKYASRAGFDYVDNIVQENPGHRWNDHDVEYAYRDGIIAGAKWQKGQMMKEAIDCVVCAGTEWNKWVITYLGDYESMVKTCKHGDRVRIIILKEEEEEK